MIGYAHCAVPGRRLEYGKTRALRAHLAGLTMIVKSVRNGKKIPPIESGEVIERSVRHGLTATIIGEGDGTGTFRIFLKPISFSQPLICLKVNVSPSSVLTSMLTAKSNGYGGPLRSSLGTNSAR